MVKEYNDFDSILADINRQIDEAVEGKNPKNNNKNSESSALMHYNTAENDQGTVIDQEEEETVEQETVQEAEQTEESTNLPVPYAQEGTTTDVQSEYDRGFNQRLFDAHTYHNGVVKLRDLENENAWEAAVDTVTYPVQILNAYFKLNDEFVNANGSTPTGRDKHYNLVVVDQYRNGEFEAIQAVTGQYGSLNTADLYTQLRNELNDAGHNHTPVKLVVSGNGGRQTLTVQMDDMRGVGTTPDEFVMEVNFATSVDGTRHHMLSLTARNLVGDTSINFYGGEFKFKARHTTTIANRTQDFLPEISNMLNAWNDMVVPSMELMYDEKFDRQAALSLIDRLAERAKISDKHVSKIRELYESSALKTNATDDSLYRINHVFNEYAEENMEDKPDLMERTKANVAKEIDKEIKKIQNNR